MLLKHTIIAIAQAIITAAWLDKRSGDQIRQARQICQLQVRRLGQALALLARAIDPRHSHTEVCRPRRIPGVRGLKADLARAHAEVVARELVDTRVRLVNTHLLDGKNTVQMIAYNTELVSKEARPKILEDLLDPRWKKGKLVMDTTDERWFTQTLDKMGEERGLAYMKKLAAQEPQFRRGHTMMLQLLAVGEFPVNVIAYGYQVEYLKKQGAPIDWSADEPVTSTGGVISLAKHAPHPEAAKLFIDFAMSKVAQEEITKFNRVATRVDVPPDPPHLVEGLKMAPVKPELGKILRNRTVQFRKIFGIQ